MIAATLLAIFFVPLFYSVIEKISHRKEKKEAETTENQFKG